MGYYVPNRVKPVCYNCPYRTNKYCGLLTEHDYLGDYPLSYEEYPHCPLVEVKDKPQTDCNGCKFVGTYDTEFPCANCKRKTKDYYAKTEPQTEREGK